MFDTDEYKLKMTEAVEHFKGEMKKVRTGRAHPSMLDGVMVEVYGTKMPLNQVSNMTAPEAGMILITPFDANNISAISAAVRNDQSLGFNPSDDGRVVRVPVPPLTEERRKQIVKQTSEKVEGAKITLRNIRQDALKYAKKLKDEKKMTEDDLRGIEKEIDAEIKEFSTQIEAIFKDKEKEILTI